MWDKASELAKENFKDILSNKLNNLNLPNGHSCNDVHCNSSDHFEDIETYTLQIMEAMEEAGLESLPSSCSQGPQKRPKISGWNEYVKPYAMESDFWYQVWVSAGKPINGDLFYNMKHSKRQFKFAVRRLKRCSDTIQSDKFISSLLDGGVNLFDEIRKFRGSRQTYSSRIVGSRNIANHFF